MNIRWNVVKDDGYPTIYMCSMTTPCHHILPDLSCIVFSLTLSLSLTHTDTLSFCISSAALRFNWAILFLSLFISRGLYVNRRRFVYYIMPNTIFMRIVRVWIFKRWVLASQEVESPYVTSHTMYNEHECQLRLHSINDVENLLSALRFQSIF